MRKILAITVGVILLAAATIVASPWISEKKLEWDCPESEASPSEDCVKRMRAAGHMWSGLSNLPNAEYWYRRGSKSGDPIAMFHLAWVYEEFAVEIAKTAMTAAAKQLTTAPLDLKPSEDFDPSDPTSLFKKFDFSPEYHAYIDQAEAWYRTSADSGFAPSMNNLAQIYSVNPLRKPAYESALKLHKAAAKAGNPIAQWNIGLTYSAGKGVKADPGEAANWWTWIPGKQDKTQFASPVLERTRLFGTTMPRNLIKELRHNAQHAIPVTMKPRSLSPNPTLGGFAQVREELQRRATTKK